MILYVAFIIFNFGFLHGSLVSKDYEEQKMDFIVDIIVSNFNHKGWTNVITVGSLPNAFYKIGQKVPVTFIVTNEEFSDYEVNEIWRYRANAAVLECDNIEDFEKKFNILRFLPYWHPHTHTLIYYHGPLTKQITAKIFFFLWYYMCANSIIIQYNDIDEKFMVTYFSPYIYENYKLDHHYGCWTSKKISFPIENFNNSYVCTEGCNNVTLYSVLQKNHLGTCVGLRTHIVGYNDKNFHKNINIFEEKGKNLHGFPLRALAVEVLPFLMVDKNFDGTYTLRERDGKIWNTLAKLLNFTIDLTLSANFVNKPFNFEFIINCIYDFSLRKADLLLMPVYQFNFIFVDVDMSVPFKESGVCFIAHRAGFETTLFDYKFVNSNFNSLLEALFCFVGTWFVFFVFNIVEKGAISFDQAGKDFVNAIRNVLSISLYKPPRKKTFRIFLLVSIWSFFVINFATQAAIISFFSAYKRGKDVETFKDITDKGYAIEGVASPDVMLPETDEVFIKINSKIVHVPDLFECVNKIGKDPRRFCINDCSVSRYLERNLLNEKGEQFLHIAEDQIHNHYLTMILHKHSPLTDHFNKYMLRIIQAGLINKWEEYRFNEMKEEVLVKSLSMAELLGIFDCYCVLLGLSIVIFLLEVLVKNAPKVNNILKLKYSRWHRTRNALE